jgi:antitoxin component YwqK of YwqJK toxin-antitoxin module
MSQDNYNVSETVDDNVLQKIKAHQNLFFAIAGGLLSALISALLWAAITISIEYQVGFMAIGVGLLVGFSVRYFGGGIDKAYSIIGALFALLGCLLGNLFTQIGFIANAESIGYFEVFGYLNLNLIILLYQESFSPIDLLFYGLAIYEGYRFSIRNITDDYFEKVRIGESNGEPEYSKYRVPLVVFSIIVIAGFAYKINLGATGFTTYYYESGNKSSEGELVNGNLHGKWVYFNEQGDVISEGNFLEGNMDSTWVWYNDNGGVSKTGEYVKGREHGIWISYYDNGIVSDSGRYNESRMEGEWVYYYENGNYSQKGNYIRGQKNGEWVYYYEDGTISSIENLRDGEFYGVQKTYFMNGQIAEELEYRKEDDVYIKNVWLEDGTHVVINGNGIYKTYFGSNAISSEGKVENGKNVGFWKYYYENGSMRENGEYKNDTYLVLNTWDVNGNKEVESGEGSYCNYSSSGNLCMVSGQIKNGLKQGAWVILLDTTGSKYQEIKYKDGKANGKNTIFYPSGNIYAEGNIINDLREGDWYWYLENGDKSSHVKFINDKKQGKQTMWSETGKPVKYEYYENGILAKEEIL